MAGRLNNLAPIGSLLKTPGQSRGKSIAGKKSGRDDKHLALIRQLPCVKCGASPCDAAHVRMASAEHNKQPGIMKPDDKWALPLCHEHHMEQHREGENEFWARLKIDPIALCLKLKAAGSVEKMRAVIDNKSAPKN